MVGIFFRLKTEYAAATLSVLKDLQRKMCTYDDDNT